VRLGWVLGEGRDGEGDRNENDAEKEGEKRKKMERENGRRRKGEGKGKKERESIRRGRAFPDFLVYNFTGSIPLRSGANTCENIPNNSHIGPSLNGFFAQASSRPIKMCTMSGKVTVGLT